MNRQTIRARAQWPLLALLFLGVVAIISLWLFLTRPLGSNSREESHYIEGVVGKAARLNPLYASLNDVDRDVVSLVFSGLTRLGPRGEILPDLAESWEISGDGLTYTFHLRQGVTWHTGVEFTADDVIFTYSILADPQFESDPSLSPLWRQVECGAPDPLTVRCQLPQPFAPFLSFTTIGILPRHILGEVSPQELFDHPFNQAPVGTGPYRLAQLDDLRAILKRNPAYHLGPPNIDEIELRFYPDAHAAMTALHRQEIQGLLLGPDVSQEDLQALAAREELRVYSANRSAYTLVYFNNRLPLLADKRVRQAIAYAVDRDAILSELLGGRALRADTPIVPGTWAYDPEIKPYPHDLDKAQALLDEVGWRLGDNGIRQKDGVEFRLSLATDSDPVRTALAEAIAQQLKEIGIEVAVVSLGATDLVEDFLLPGDYQAALFGYDPGYDPDLYPAWHSSQTDEDGRNLAGYANQAADVILEQARQVTDIDRRREMYGYFQDIFREDVPSLLLYYPVYNYFVHKRVEGVELGVLFETSSRFANVQEWTIQEQELLGS